MSFPELQRSPLGELGLREQNLLAARALVPIVIAVAYGIYEFIRRGTSPDYALYTYVPVSGGVAATGGLMVYFLRVVSPDCAKVSWGL